MLKIKPVITEKSIAEAKKGNYTFFVPKSFTKFDIRSAILSIFGVRVKEVKTLSVSKLVRRGIGRLPKKKISQKKAVVKLYPKEKIDLFEIKEK